MSRSHSWRRSPSIVRLLLIAVSGLAFGEAAHAQLVRRDLGNLDANSATLQAYQRAVAAMKSLPPNDPHSWVFQANIHGFPAGSGNVDSTWGQCQHANWWFLPWHRAYLYFAERIMRRYSGDASFALPYWNYADPRQRTVPAAFRNPASTLYDATRRPAANSGADALSEFIVVQGTNQSLANIVFADFNPQAVTFGGPALQQPQHSGSTFGALENLPHNWVHGFLGGNMSDPDRAARDPLFFVHHANIDRLWDVWLQLGGGRGNPSVDSWLNQSFTFFDENKQRVTITMRQAATSAGLGYTYEGLGGTAVAQPAQAIGRSNLVQVASVQMSEPRRIDSAVTVSLTPTRPTSITTGPTTPPKPRSHRVYLVVGGVEFAPRPDSSLAVFVNLPAQQRTASPQDRHFAGYAAYFGDVHHGADAQHKHDGQTCTLDITPTIARLYQNGEWTWSETNITLERVSPGTQPSRGTAVLTFKEISLLTRPD